MPELWRIHDKQKKADALRRGLRLSTAEKKANDVFIARGNYDSDTRYESSTEHRSLGEGCFQAVNRIGDNKLNIY